MTFLISLILAGVVFTTGNNIFYENQHTLNLVGSNSKVSKKNISHDDKTEDFEKTYQFNRNGKVELSSINGSVTIETWDKPQIKLKYTKVAHNRELSDLEVKVNAQRNSFKVETDYKKTNQNKRWDRGSKLYVKFHLTVPRTARLDEIVTVNGSIKASNLSNYSHIETVNGKITANNLRGTTKLSAVNGTIYADFDELRKDSTINLEVVNGSVKLTLPSDSNATIKADTVHGRIRNDFGLPIRKGRYVGRDLYGKIGNGDVGIKLSSVNGSLSIQRKNDGKNLSPATNLLRKSSDDEWEDSNSQGQGKSRYKGKYKSKYKGKYKDKYSCVNCDSQAKRGAEIARRNAERSAEIARKNAERSAEIARRNAELMTEQSVKLSASVMENALKNMRFFDGSFYSNASYIEEKKGSFVTKGTPTVVINTQDCSVIVRGWDKQEVKYSVTKLFRDRGNLVTSDGQNIQNKNNLDIQANGDGKNIRLKVINKGNTRIVRSSEGKVLTVDNQGGNKVRLEVFVPKESNIELRTEDGDVRVEDVSGKINLNGEDSAINVREGKGRLKVDSVDGVIRVIGFDGRVNAKVEDSTMSLEGNFEKLSAEAKDGTIILDLPEDKRDRFANENSGFDVEGNKIIFRNVEDKKVGY